MKTILVYNNPEYVYGNYNGTTSIFKVISIYGDWFKIDGAVKTTNNTMTNVVHKDRLVYYLEE